MTKPAPYKKTRKENPNTKKNIAQTRLDNEEMQVFVEKAFMYAGGEISELIRIAVFAYRPTTKQLVGK